MYSIAVPITSRETTNCRFLLELMASRLELRLFWGPWPGKTKSGMQMQNTVRKFFPGRDSTPWNSFRPTAQRITWIVPRPIAHWLVVGLILCPMMCACRPRGSRTIAMIPATTGPELWGAAHGGAEIAGREAGFPIYWNGPTREDDVATQIALIERAIDNGDAGLVVVPTNYLALVGSVRQALSRHIPTVVIR